MKAICDTCGARYRIPEEKLEGKILRIRCRKCDNVFTVRDEEPAASASAPPGGAAQGDWFFAINGESFGPYTEDEILHRFESGRLERNTHVWRQGMDAWMPVEDYAPFAAAIQLAQTALPSARPPRPVRPTPSRTEDAGSGRFTVEVRRPGATLDQQNDVFGGSNSDVSDDVDDAFDSMLGGTPSRAAAKRPMRGTVDPESETATTPMRMGHVSPAKTAATPAAATPAATPAAAKTSATQPSRTIAPTRPTPASALGERTPTGPPARKTAPILTPSAAAGTKPAADAAATPAPIAERSPAVKTASLQAAGTAIADTVETTPLQAAITKPTDAEERAPAVAATPLQAAVTTPADTVESTPAVAATPAESPAASTTSAALPPAGGALSLSERLRQIRERSTAGASTSLPAAGTAAKPAGLPPSRSPLPSARPLPAARPLPVTRPGVAPTQEEAAATAAVVPAAVATPTAIDEPVVDTHNDLETQVVSVPVLDAVDEMPSADAAEEPTANVSVAAATVAAATAAAATAAAAVEAAKPAPSHATLFDDDDALFASDDEGSAAIFARDGVDSGEQTAVKAVAALTPSLPVGPTRHVTQEISLEDFFGGDEFEENGTPGRGSSLASSTNDEPAWGDAELGVSVKPASTEAETQATVAAVASMTAAALAASSARSAASSRSAPRRTGAQSTLPDSGATGSLTLPRADRSKQLRMLMLAIAGLTCAALILLFVVSRRTAAIAEQAEAAAVAEAARQADEIEARRLNGLQVMARNRASSVVALAVTQAGRAAHVAGEANLAERKASSTPERSGASRASRDEGTAAAMGFYGNVGARPVSTTARQASSSGPSSSHFASTLQGGVRTSVGRCAQRARARDGGLSFSRVELSITIRPDGTVEKISAPRGIRETTFMNCMTTESTRWRFASFSGGNTTITHPYVVQ